MHAERSLFDSNIMRVPGAFARKIELKIKPPDVAGVLLWVSGNFSVVDEFDSPRLIEYVTDAAT